MRKFTVKEGGRMPIPKPYKNERQNEFISRCISELADIGEYKPEQRTAICYSAWDNKNKEEKAMVFTHNSKTEDGEPGWGSVDKTKLPRKAFADMGEADKKSTWSYPHHWIKNGKVGEDGVYESGDMFLHKGGLNAAWAAAQGARSGNKASPEIISHLNTHRKALGLEKEEQTIESNISSSGTHGTLAGQYEEFPPLPEGFNKPKTPLEYLEDELKLP